MLGFPWESDGQPSLLQYVDKKRVPRRGRGPRVIRLEGSCSLERSRWEGGHKSGEPDLFVMQMVGNEKDIRAACVMALVYKLLVFLCVAFHKAWRCASVLRKIASPNLLTMRRSCLYTRLFKFLTLEEVEYFVPQMQVEGASGHIGQFVNAVISVIFEELSLMRLWRCECRTATWVSY